MNENWAQPNPTAMLEETDPPLPDTESLLSELGAWLAPENVQVVYAA